MGVGGIVTGFGGVIVIDCIMLPEPDTFKAGVDAFDGGSGGGGWDTSMGGPLGSGGWGGGMLIISSTGGGVGGLSICIGGGNGGSSILE